MDKRTITKESIETIIARVEVDGERLALLKKAFNGDHESLVWKTSYSPRRGSYRGADGIFQDGNEG